MRDSYYWHNRVGFFCASLRTQADVTRKRLHAVQKFTKHQFNQYDAVIFNYECNFREEGYPIITAAKAVRELKTRLAGVPCILLITSPNAKLVPEDKTMELFDLVFRREHYKDLDRYKLTGKNKEKLRTTTLSCPLIPATILNYNRINPAKYGFDTIPEVYDNDVFFLGQETSGTMMRTIVINEIKSSNLKFLGGIHPDVRKSKQTISPDLLSPRLSKKKFYDATRSSKINLALEGYGQFTYRHWECWALSAFMISSPSVNEVKLPFKAADGEHYITFENIDDLMDKINYYLRHADKREQIIKNGRELFKREYNFHRHGRYIVNAIEEIL